MQPGYTNTEQWHRRAVTPRGFKKMQLLAQEWTIMSPRTPRKPTRESPRVAKIVTTLKTPEEVKDETLRFAAYISESQEWAFSGDLGWPEHKVHIRKLLLTYHLDGTIQVTEEKTCNSGVAGGQFFSRGVPPEPIKEEDLRVGQEVKFLGQTFYIVDCDEKTRSYYAKKGTPQPPGVPYPSALPLEYHAEHATGLLGKPNDQARYGRYGGKEVFRKSQNFPERKLQYDKERLFFKTNGEVLKFKVLWDDPAPGGRSHTYVLAFHLASNQAEFIESGSEPPPKLPQDEDALAPPSGKNQNEKGGPHLLSKTRLLLNWYDVTKLGADPQYAVPATFKVGATIDVFNRSIKIIDCSPFTRHWYQTNLGIQQPFLEKKKSNQLEDQEANQVPEEDDEDRNPLLLGNPKQKKRNAERLDVRRRLQLCDKVVRFRLAQVATKPSDAPRTFVATFFLADNAIQIFEDQIVNSGILGGAFLKRSKVKHVTATGLRYLRPSDLYLDAVLEFSKNNKMRIAEIDAASLKTMADLPHLFPFASPSSCLAKLSQTNWSDLRNLLRSVSPESPTSDVLKNLLTAHERLTLASAYPTRADLANALLGPLCDL